MVWVPKATIALANDQVTASLVLNATSAARAALENVIDGRVPDVVAEVIATDPTVVDAAAERALTTEGVVTATPSAPTPGDEMILAGSNDEETWIQARGEVDPVSGVALPTAKTVEALGRAGIPAAAGSGDLVITSEDGSARTWWQASRFVRANGVAGPTQEALDTLALSGVPVLFDGAPPTDLDLEPGEIRIYLNDGEPMLAVGS